MPSIPVDELLLDAENPRLPEALRGASQSELFAYLFETGVLDELVESLAENGYFEHEPMIVLPPDEGDERVVVEGNRRLAALMLIHSLPAAEGFRPSIDITEAHREALRTVPCYEVADRDAVRRFLGYRHISGLKPWRPEAKARYLANEIELAASTGEANPFLHVARMVGSNTVGVRNVYSAYAILRHGRDECGVAIGYLVEERFGVWVRCMNSAEIRGYISYGSPKTYGEVVEAVSGLDCDRLSEVIADLTPSGREEKPVVYDSRQVTLYGLVLENDAARAALRKYRNLDLASQVVRDATFSDRIRKMRHQVDALTDEIQTYVTEAEEGLVEEATRLTRSSRLLEAVISALSPVAEEDANS